MTEDKENNRLAYVTYHDIRKIKSFSGNTVIAIKAPAETRLEVPDPKEVQSHDLVIISTVQIDLNLWLVSVIAGRMV